MAALQEFFLVWFPLVVQSGMHLVFISCLAGKRLKLGYCGGYLLLACTMQSYLLSIAGMLLALCLLARFPLGLKWSVSGVAALLSVYVSQVSFGMVNSLESILFPALVGRDVLFLLVILATLLALALCGGCYWLLLQKLSLGDTVYRPDLWLLLLPSLFLFTAELYILQTAYAYLAPGPSEPGKHLLLFLLQVLGLVVLLCTLYAYQRVCAGLEAQQALSALTLAAQAQKNYVSEASLRYEKTRSFRHDLKNHLSVLDGLLQTGAVEEARAYLDKLEATASALSFPIQTGEAAVDTLLGEKLTLARDCEIETTVSLVLPRDGTVDALDWCVIFANALDNAVQASLLVEGRRTLSLRGERQGDFYHLDFENTCLPGPMPPLGVGLSNIKAVAEKYHGAMLAEKEDTRFRLNVLLNISEQPDDSSRQSH